MGIKAVVLGQYGGNAALGPAAGAVLQLALGNHCHAVCGGQLQGGGKGVEAIEDFARKQSAALEALGGLVMRAKEKTKEDPVLIEFKEQIGGAGS